MVDVKTPYQKFFRRAYQTAFDLSGVNAGMWVKIDGTEAKAVADGDTVTGLVLKPVISRLSDNTYEGHDTTPAGTITVIDDFGVVMIVDGDGVEDATISAADWLTVGSTDADDDTGKLVKAAAADQVVARCINIDGDNYEIQTVSPFILNSTA